MPGQHGDRHSCIRVVDGQCSQVHVTEQFQAFGKFVRSQNAVRKLYKVWPQVYIFMTEHVCDVYDLMNFAFLRIKVRTKFVPVQDIL